MVNPWRETLHLCFFSSAHKWLEYCVSARLRMEQLLHVRCPSGLKDGTWVWGSPLTAGTDLAVKILKYLIFKINEKESAQSYPEGAKGLSHCSWNVKCREGGFNFFLLAQDWRKDLCSLGALVFTCGYVTVWTRQNNFCCDSAPCSLPLPTSLYCCWVVGRVISVTGLLLRFAEWIYVNCIWDEWKTATAGDTAVAASQRAASVLPPLNWLQELVLDTCTFKIHSPSVCSPCRHFLCWAMFVPLPHEWSQLRTCLPSLDLYLNELAFFLRPWTWRKE